MENVKEFVKAFLSYTKAYAFLVIASKDSSIMAMAAVLKITLASQLSALSQTSI